MMIVWDFSGTATEGEIEVSGFFVACSALIFKLNCWSIIIIIIISPSMRMVNVFPTLSKYSVIHHHAPIGIFCLRE